MNALVESLLAPAPEVDPEDATNFDDGTAARTSTGFKAGEDLAVIPKRRLVDDGEAPVGLAKSSRAELFDDGLDSGDDDVVPEDDDDIDEAIYGDDESDESDAEPQATRQMSVFSKTDDGVDDLLDSFDAEDQAGAAKAAEKAPAKQRGARCARAHADLEADVLEFRVLLEGALRAAAKVEPGQCDPDAAAACQQLCAAFLELRDAASGAEERERDIADADALWEDLEEGHRQKRPKWEAAAEAWRRKTHLGATQASMGLKATNLGPFEQARLAATQDEERARKKMWRGRVRFDIGSRRRRGARRLGGRSAGLHAVDAFFAAGILKSRTGLRTSNSTTTRVCIKRGSAITRPAAAAAPRDYKACSSVRRAAECLEARRAAACASRRTRS